MPTFKTGVAAKEVKTGFEAYDGPIPDRRGFYRAKIDRMEHGKNSGGSEGFTIVLVLEAADGDPKNHAMYDGYTMFSYSTITATKDGSPLKEGSVNNLSNLFAALGTKDDPAINVAEPVKDGAKGIVKTIGGKNPVGTIVNVDMGFETYEESKRPTVSGIFKYSGEQAKSAGKPAALEPDEEPDETEEPEDGADDEQTYEERETELNGLGLAALRKLASEDYDLETKGLKKAELIGVILEHEFEGDEDEEAEGEEPEDEESEEEEVEEAEEAEDDEEEEEEEEPEDEEDEARAERETELETFDRNALKKILKGLDATQKIFPSNDEENLRGRILAIEFPSAETPF